ncbi:hypothetical protein [Streptacidiphilus sp. MAP5-52]|uniref:hypothetical protein n=1 Tax=Streptacidiphilus sp. MAP5-52 TaxID=3156267 RepID=UPI0035123392
MENHLLFYRRRTPHPPPLSPLPPTAPVRASGRWYTLGRRRVWLERSSLTDRLDARADAMRQLERVKSWRPSGF